MHVLLKPRKFYCVTETTKDPYIYISSYKQCIFLCVKKNLRNTLYTSHQHSCTVNISTVKKTTFHCVPIIGIRTFVSSLVFSHSYKCSGSTVEALQLYRVSPYYMDLGTNHVTQNLHKWGCSNLLNLYTNSPTNHT